MLVEWFMFVRTAVSEAFPLSSCCTQPFCSLIPAPSSSPSHTPCFPRGMFILACSQLAASALLQLTINLYPLWSFCERVAVWLHLLLWKRISQHRRSLLSVPAACGFVSHTPALCLSLAPTSNLSLLPCVFITHQLFPSDRFESWLWSQIFSDPRFKKHLQMNCPWLKYFADWKTLFTQLWWPVMYCSAEGSVAVQLLYCWLGMIWPQLEQL